MSVYEKTRKITIEISLKTVNKCLFNKKKAPPQVKHNLFNLEGAI